MSLISSSTVCLGLLSGLLSSCLVSLIPGMVTAMGADEPNAGEVSRGEQPTLCRRFRKLAVESRPQAGIPAPHLIRVSSSPGQGLRHPDRADVRERDQPAWR
jgi:hypothetical protein